MTSTVPTAPEIQQRCPACGAQTSGKFCSECGASLGQSRCASCRAELISGARFCHRCGLPAGVAAPQAERGQSALSMPWIVAAIALLALVALVAGQRFGGNRPAVSETAEATPPVSAVRGPDISSLTPEQAASMLFDRIMRYHEAGATDSLQEFAPMAIAAYGMLPTLDLDARYDLGRIGEVSGNVALARAQSDTILRANPNHLLGLILGAHAARLERRSADE